MEDEEDSPEVSSLVIPNSPTDIPSTNPDEQPPLEQFGEVPAGDFAEEMM
jgi:hypothetical protein